MKFARLYLYYALSVIGNPQEYYYSEQDRGRPVIPVGTSPDTLTHSFCHDVTKIYTYYDVAPRKGRELTAVEVPLSIDKCSSVFGTATVPRYLVQLTENNVPIYGWIDGFEPVQTKGPSSNTLIRWHVDYWMVFQHWRTVGSPYTMLTTGRIKRGPKQICRPEPSDPALWVYKESRIIQSTVYSAGPYQIMLITRTTGSGSSTNTTFHVLTWQCSAADQISLADIYSGYTEEYLGLDPNAIIGAWFAPVPAFEMTVERRKTNTSSIGGTKAFYEIDAGEMSDYHSNFVLDTYETNRTDDYHKWMIVDPIGTVYATLPWSVPWRYLVMDIDVGPNGAYLVVHASESILADVADLGEGRVSKIPLIPAPITSNDWSSYVYSGQREYDMRMAEIQKNQSAAGGISGIGTSALSGAIMGSVAPGIGTAIGAGVGLVTGLIGTASSYLIQGEMDKKSQAQTDKLMSNQTASVLINSGGSQWLHDSFTLGKWRLVLMEGDQKSMTALAAEQQTLGYVTDYFTDDLEAVLNSYKGPFRVEGQQFDGNFPNEGRVYISALLERGVILK